MTGDGDSAALFDRAAARRRAAMESVLWDPARGAWFDYDLVTRSKRSDFYPSNLAPVWARCYSRPEMGEQAVKYLKVKHKSVAPPGVLQISDHVDVLSLHKCQHVRPCTQLHRVLSCRPLHFKYLAQELLDACRGVAAPVSPSHRQVELRTPSAQTH